MQQKHSQSRILAGLLAAMVVVLVGVIAVSNSNQVIPSALAQDQGVGAVETPQEMMRELDQLIQRYQAIELDAGFLASPGFRALRDFSITLPRPASVGRENPFAPLPGADTDSVPVANFPEVTPFATAEVSFGQLINNEL